MKRIFITMSLMLSLFSTAVLADYQTLTLNTGFDHDPNQNSRYGVNQKDQFWTLYYDQGIVPLRTSDTMSPYPVWQAEMADSQWITFAPQGIPVNNNKPYRTYIFQKCFCLKKGFDREENLKNLSLELKLRADDWATVYLNEPLINILTPPAPMLNAPFSILSTTNTTGGFGIGGASSDKTLTGRDLLSKVKLQVGKNCLQVKLYDMGLVVSGFNLTGALTAVGIDGVAKGTNPRTMYSSCSSCSGVKNLIDVPKMIEPIREN